ncbi:MAG: hypothetical protein M3209_08330 [Acidobacteriota bacterium]|nr:hypothetical protein [Acidobacteriota bacterium]
MREKYVRLLILGFGFVILSDLISLFLLEPAARCTSAFLMMMCVYRFPSRLQIDFVKWLKGSVLTSIVVLFINTGILNSLSVFLVLVFFVLWINLSFFKKEQL